MSPQTARFSYGRESPGPLFAYPGISVVLEDLALFCLHFRDRSYVGELLKEWKTLIVNCQHCTVIEVASCTLLAR